MIPLICPSVFTTTQVKVRVDLATRSISLTANNPVLKAYVNFNYAGVLEVKRGGIKRVWEVKGARKWLRKLVGLSACGEWLATQTPHCNMG